LTDPGQSAPAARDTETDPDEALRERLLDSRILAKGRYLTFRIDRIVRADGSIATAPGFATELMHLYLATGLREVGEGRRGPDEDERLRMTAVPWRVALAMAEAGEIRDAKSLVALLWLARLKESEVAPPARV
jgi:8-oxo-dGTP pyrophosphatase MutT (NUDIX family)